MRPAGQTKQQLEVRRRTAMALLDLGQKPAQIARALGCDVSSIHRWRRAVRTGGAQALTALVEKKPRAPKLDAPKRAWIRQVLTKDPTRFGFETALWTLGRLRTLLIQRFGIEQSEAHLSRVVRSLGFSTQRPQRRMRQHDVAAVETFRRERWPAIKKSSAPKGARS